MDEHMSTQFVSALTEFLQFLCNKYVEYDEFTLVTGQLYVSSDSGDKTEFHLDEKLCTSEKSKVICHSNSFPSTISRASSPHNTSNNETHNKSNRSVTSEAERQPVDSGGNEGNEGTSTEVWLQEVMPQTQDSHTEIGDSSSKSVKFEAKKRSRRSRINTPEDANPYKCEFCNKSYDVISKLTKHMKNHSKPHKCETCSKSYASNADLQRHMRTHSGEKPFICAICARAFPDSSRLKMHEKVHSEEKLYSCGVCGKAFRQQGNLKSHIYTHTGEKPFQCDFCGKCFTQRSHMKVHRATHNKVRNRKGKPTADNDDAKGAERKDENVVNISSSHARVTVPKTLKRPRQFGEKMHYCDICGKSFRQMGNLKIHKYTHTGEKPFQCSFCGKCFTQKSHLNVHRAKYCKVFKGKFVKDKQFVVLETPQTIHEDMTKTHETAEAIHCSGISVIQHADANAAILLEQSLLKEEELQYSQHPDITVQQSHMDASQATFNPSEMSIIHQVDLNAAALIERSTSMDMPSITFRQSNAMAIEAKWPDNVQKYL